MYISDLLKEHRKQVKKSNNEIAEESGIPLNTVNKLLSVGSKAPSVYTVGPICRVLNVSLDEYFGIVTKDMGKEEIDRITESYEANKLDLERTIAFHTQHSAYKDDIISMQNKMVSQLEDRISYQKRAIFWLRVGIGASVLYGVIMDALSSSAGFIRY